MRASSYNIYVDLPGTDRHRLLLHGYTGAFDRVSVDVAEWVESLETPSSAPLHGKWSGRRLPQGVTAPSDSVVSVLRRRGYLTDMTADAEFAYFERVVGALRRRVQVPGYLVMPTYNCNLRCSYCFQDHLRSDPNRRHLLSTMPLSMVDRIFTAMSSIERQIGLPDTQESHGPVGFFGGEPLLAASRPVVEHVMRRAQDRGQEGFYAVTNGTELDVYEDLLGPGRLDALQITLDGPPAQHDARRIYADGSGSFERIARNIDLALDRGVDVHVRINVDRALLPSLPPLAQSFEDKGWFSRSNFVAYTAPIQPNSHVDRATTFTTLALDQALARLREQYPIMHNVERPDDRLTNEIAGIFVERKQPQLDPTFCSAHNSSYIFDAFGNVFACWEKTGDANLRIGSVDQSGNYVPDPLGDLWRSRDVTTNAVCRRCRYALHCGGGCAVLAEGRTGTMFTNYCDGFATRFKSEVATAYSRRSAAPLPTPKLRQFADL